MNLDVDCGSTLVPSERASDYVRISMPTTEVKKKEECGLHPGTSHQILFTTERTEEIDPRMADLLRDTTGNPNDFFGAISNLKSNGAFRRYFEAAWGFPGGVGSAEYPDLRTLLINNALIVFAEVAKAHRIIIASDGVTAQPILATAPELVIKSRIQTDPPVVPIRARYYLLSFLASDVHISNPQQNPNPRRADLEAILAKFTNNFQTYQEAWQVIGGFELAIPAPLAGAKEANHFLPEIETLELAAPVILRKARQLAARRDIAFLVAKNADNLLTATLGENDPDKVDAVTQNYLRLKGISWEVEEEVALLKSRAGSLGFTLEFDPAVPDPKRSTEARVKEAPPQRTFWKTTYNREEGSALIDNYRSNKIDGHSFQHIETGLKIGKPLSGNALDFDPWIEKETQLRAADPNDETGGPFPHVFRFDLTDTGYRTSSGEMLESIAKRCNEDDDFRRASALLLPLYEESLQQGKVLTKYRILKRPLPGVLPSAFPRIFVIDSYQFHTEIASAEVGEILSTINLTPGEERKIRLTKAIERESEERRTASSLLDITTEDKDDLTTEVEKVTRKEQENSQSVEASGSGGVNLGIVSFGGSAGGSARWSSKDFESNLNRSIQKTSHSVQRRTKREVSTSSSLRIKASETESFETSVKNINEGRTLNLLFFSVNNRLRGGLKINGLRLQLVYGVEIVEGSGAYPFNRYDLTTDGLKQLVRDTWNAIFPADVGALVRPAAESFRFAFLKNIVAGLALKLQKGFVPDDCAPKFDESRNFALALKRVGNDGAITYIDPASGNNGIKLSLTPGANATTPPVVIASGLDEITFGELPLAMRIVYFPSKAMYLDAQVGVMPAAEQYYESMRQQEVSNRCATAFKTYAEGLLEQAKARIYRGPTPAPPSWGPTGPLRIIAIDIETAFPDLVFTLNHPLPDGKWSILFDGEDVFALPISYAGQRFFVWPRKPDHVGINKEDAVFRLALLDKASGTKAFYEPV